MAAGSTYTPIATTTASGASTVSFTSIPSTYTDLVIVATGKSSTAGSTSNNYRIQFNGDTTSLYSNTQMYGDGTSAGSVRDSTSPYMYMALVGQTSAENAVSIINIMNYANTTTYKTVVGRGSHAQSSLQAGVGVWRSTAAINRVDLFMPSATLTGTFTIYGILAA